MNVRDKKLITDLVYQKITKEQFENDYSGNLEDGSKHFEQLLNEATADKDSEQVEFALAVGSYFKLWSSDLVNIFNDLLLKDWHFQHENIVNALQSAKNPTSIESLYLTALKEFDYLSYDDTFALARKCTWALSDIDTKESIEKLKLLAQLDNEIIKSYAEKRLANRP